MTCITSQEAWWEEEHRCPLGGDQRCYKQSDFWILPIPNISSNPSSRKKILHLLWSGDLVLWKLGDWSKSSLLSSVNINSSCLAANGVGCQGSLLLHQCVWRWTRSLLRHKCVFTEGSLEIWVSYKAGKCRTEPIHCWYGVFIWKQVQNTVALLQPQQWFRFIGLNPAWTPVAKQCEGVCVNRTNEKKPTKRNQGKISRKQNETNKKLKWMSQKKHPKN